MIPIWYRWARELFILTLLLLGAYVLAEHGAPAWCLLLCGVVIGHRSAVIGVLLAGGDWPGNPE